MELLIAHRTWLIRGTTRPPGTGIGPFEGAQLFYRPINDPGINVIDWAVARQLTRTTSTVCTEQDRQVLAVALQLAGEGKPSLRHSLDGLDGLDEANRAIAIEAIKRYAGPATNETSNPTIMPDTP